MAAIKFKVGDRVRVKKRSEITDTQCIDEITLSNKCIDGITLSNICGKETTILKVYSHGYGTPYGWCLSDEMLEPIPAAKWYVGQEVWDDVLHPGETGRITHIESNGSIIVDFNNVPCYYAFDSIYFRFISAVPYTFELPPQPEPIWIPEKWERVLVRGHELDTWRPHIFFQYLHGTPNPFQIMGKEGGCWKYCIPFDPDKVGKL